MKLGLFVELVLADPLLKENQNITVRKLYDPSRSFFWPIIYKIIKKNISIILINNLFANYFINHSIDPIFYSHRRLMSTFNLNLSEIPTSCITFIVYYLFYFNTAIKLKMGQSNHSFYRCTLSFCCKGPGPLRQIDITIKMW